MHIVNISCSNQYICRHWFHAYLSPALPITDNGQTSLHMDLELIANANLEQSSVSQNKYTTGVRNHASNHKLSETGHFRNHLHERMFDLAMTKWLLNRVWTTRISPGLLKQHVLNQHVDSVLRQRPALNAGSILLPEQGFIWNTMSEHAQGASALQGL